MKLNTCIKCYRWIAMRKYNVNLYPSRVMIRNFSDETKDEALNKEKSPIDERDKQNDDRMTINDNDKVNDKVMAAKQKLADLLNDMKIDTSVMKTDSIISSVMAKPKHHIRMSARPKDEQRPPEESIDNISKNIDKRLINAAKAIAETLADKEVKRRTESELFNLLKSHEEETVAAKDGKFMKSQDLAEVFMGMKIDRQKPQTAAGQFTREFEDRRVPTDAKSTLLPARMRMKAQELQRDRVNIYKSASLGIFDKDMKEAEDLPKLTLWNQLIKEDIEDTVLQSSTNVYEEMIRWTEQGKLWKFPIDNEQGLEAEENVPFYEHVFLDHLLEGFPSKGPVRQFMELVILGLSKNPYITVERKHVTVDYYREYFKEREEMLRVSGALG